MGARGQKLISPIEGEENATLEINGFAYKNKETSSFVFKVELDGNFNLKGINYTIKYLGTISKPLNNKLYRTLILGVFEAICKEIKKEDLKKVKMPQEKNYALLDMGAKTTGIYIYSNYRLKFNRTLLVGGNELDKKIVQELTVTENDAKFLKISNLYYRINDYDHTIETLSKIANIKSDSGESTLTVRKIFFNKNLKITISNTRIISLYSNI